LAGSALVGASVEACYGRTQWLVSYFGGGLVALGLAYWWFPHSTDGGSSDAVAGLIGTLTFAMWKAQLRPAWPAFAYAAFFAADLTALATGGVVVAAIVGNTVLALLGVLRRSPLLLPLVVMEIAALGVILTARRPRRRTADRLRARRRAAPPPQLRSRHARSSGPGQPSAVGIRGAGCGHCRTSITGDAAR